MAGRCGESGDFGRRVLSRCTLDCRTRSLQPTPGNASGLPGSRGLAPVLGPAWLSSPFGDIRNMKRTLKIIGLSAIGTTLFWIAVIAGFVVCCGKTMNPNFSFWEETDDFGVMTIGGSQTQN